MTLYRLGPSSGRLAILTAFAGCVALPVEGRPPEDAIKSITEPLSKQVTTEFLDTPLHRVLEYFQREKGVNFLLDPDQAQNLGTFAMALHMKQKPEQELVSHRTTVRVPNDGGVLSGVSRMLRSIDAQGGRSRIGRT